MSTAIEWTDATWNPVTGCDRVSPGCAHCYALDLAARWKGMGQARYQRDGDPRTSGPGFGVTLHPDKLEEPLRWRRPRMVFVNSMSDLFHEEIPDDFIARVFGVMAAAPAHIFQVLTKRPERMRALLAEDYRTSEFWVAVWTYAAQMAPPAQPAPTLLIEDRFRLTNVWLGVSIENRRYVHRADLLRETPAAVRFVSAEPLLGPLLYDSKAMWHPGSAPAPAWASGFPRFAPELDLAGIDWLIVGGESGPKHRPMRIEWVRDLRDACHADDPEGCYCPEADGTFDPAEDCHGQCHTAFFFKQWGGRTPKAGGRELDGRTWDEFPAPAREAAAA